MPFAIPADFIPPHRRVGMTAATGQPVPAHAVLKQSHEPANAAHSSPEDVTKRLPDARGPDDGNNLPQNTHLNGQATSTPPANPPVGVPLRSKNDRWIKNSELKNNRWRNNQSYDRGRGLTTRLSSNWVDTTAMVTSNGISLAEIKDGAYSLMNYDGTWAPAPLDWDIRPAFRDHQSAESIGSWLEVVEGMSDKQPLRFVLKDSESTNFYQNIPDDGNTQRYYFTCPPANDKPMGEIVPISWRPEPMEGGSSLAEFWGGLLVNLPIPCDPEDLQNVKPWWEHTLSPMACFQLPLRHPEVCGIDVTDQSSHEQRLRYEDKGANHAIERWNMGYRHGRGRRGGRGRALGGRYGESFRAAEAIPEMTDPLTTEAPEELVIEPPLDVSIHPKMNLYVRRAQTGDMAQVTTIYNYYVTNTVRVPENNAVLPSHMRNRLQMITAAAHCFVVACLPTGAGSSGKAVIKGPGKRNKGFTATCADRVIGFAYSDDFNGPSGMYRFLAEVEVYVDQEFLRKGVASCLLDKLFGILDPNYSERGGYEIRDDDFGCGASRVVDCMWINYPYVQDDDDKDWATKWLGSLGFAQTGEHKKVAYKVGKMYVYSHAIDQGLVC